MEDRFEAAQAQAAAALAMAEKAMVAAKQASAAAMQGAIETALLETFRAAVKARLAYEVERDNDNKVCDDADTDAQEALARIVESAMGAAVYAAAKAIELEPETIMDDEETALRETAECEKAAKAALAKATKAMSPEGATLFRKLSGN